MAREVVTLVKVYDDLTREELAASDARSVVLGLDGKSWELDLSAANAEELAKLVQPYIDAGRPVRPPPRARSSRSPIGQPRVYKTHNARRWARRNGWPDLPENGRLPGDVIAAYLEAHPSIEGGTSGPPTPGGTA